MTLVLVNLVLAFAWAAVSGSFTLLNIVFGFVLGGAALLLLRGQVGQVTYFRRTWLVTVLIAIFLWELVKSSVRVAAIVLAPKRDLSPAIIAYPLTCDRDFEITVLANLITLTPGTLSVDVSDDRKTLYIHSIDVPYADALVTDIRDAFERRILETFR